MRSRLGDEIPGHIPADIVFTLQEKPHKVYKREGDDLVVVKDISLREALCGLRFEYQHINGRYMNQNNVIMDLECQFLRVIMSLVTWCFDSIFVSQRPFQQRIRKL